VKKRTIVTTKQGYILVMALMIMTIGIALTTQLFNKGMLYASFSTMAVNREKATQLALAGTQIAMSQLSVAATQESKSGQAAQSQKSSEEKKVLEKILPMINRAQSFELKHEIEGIDATISVIISCEEGKININALYDFAQKKFVNEGQAKGDGKKFLQDICLRIESLTGGKNLFFGLEKYLKDHNRKLNDVTELFNIPEFGIFKNLIFYESSHEKAQGEKTQGKRPIYVTDIFTVDSDTSSIEPWLFSDSVCALLGLKRATGGEIHQRKEMVGDLLKDFKPEMVWQKDFDRYVAKIYGKDFTSLPKDIDYFFNMTFNPRTFSVLSLAKVGTMTVKMYALLTKIEEPLEQKSGEHKVKTQWVVKKMYWI
jgi:hypothetical protein